MGSLKSLGQGFLIAAGLVWIFNIVSLVRGGDAWLGFLYLLILFVPISSLTYLRLKNKNFKQTADSSSPKWRNLLFSFQGVALAFWLLDILTTFYAINVTRLAYELNPLGWPMGILGALAYYAPTLFFSYFLLFKSKEKIAFYAAIPLTLITIGMCTMNLMAGIQNFQVFVDTATLASGMRYTMLTLIVMVNVVVLLTLNRTVSQPKPALAIKKR